MPFKKIQKITIIFIYLFCFKNTYSSNYMCHFECSIGADGQTPWRKLDKISATNFTNAHTQIEQKYYPICLQNWLNSDYKIFGDIPWVWSLCEQAMPEKAGDIAGRDLNIIGAGWAGHIGVASDANNIYEVINAANNVIQYNTFTKFRESNISKLTWGHYIEIPWSNYWGATYKPNDNFTNATAMFNFINTQKNKYTPIYTLFAPNTKVGKAGKECSNTNLLGQCTAYRNYIQAVYRCDTFVNEAYKASRNGELVGGYSSFLTPAYVFNNISRLFKQRRQ